MREYLSSFALIAAIAAAPSADAVTPSGHAFVGGVDGRLAPVSVGSVVARGTLVDGLCRFPGTTSFGAEGIDRTSHITTTVTPACTMVVDAMGPAEDATTVGAGVVNVLADVDGVPGITDAALEPRTKVARKGETEFTILEQFNITAYELNLKLSALQDTNSGDISGGTLSGYCYVSGFPGNEIEACFGDTPSRGGDYAEARAWGKFDNTTVGGPEMYLHTVHIITRSSSGGLCELIEGNYPPLWRGDCKITRIN